VGGQRFQALKEEQGKSQHQQDNQHNASQEAVVNQESNPVLYLMVGFALVRPEEPQQMPQSFRWPVGLSWGRALPNSQQRLWA
tara:strand:- start:3 stop:251 length:249 start_codon:yes stop_codon:yes gene_type:complete